MRVTQSMLYRQTLNNMQQREAGVLQRQNEIASGVRLNQAKDDPSGMGRVMRNDDRQVQLARFGDNIRATSARLSFIESELDGVGDLLHRGRELMVAGANGTQSDESLQAIANELRSLGEAMLSIANGRDGQGRFLFAGFNDQQQPFAGPPGAIAYQGAASARSIAIDDRTMMADGVVGEDVFLNGPAGDLFQMFDDLADALQAPNGTPAEQAARKTAIANGLDRLDDSLGGVLTTRSQIGVDLQQLELADERLNTIDIELQKDSSGVRDTDIAEAVSDMTQQMTMLEAARKTFVQIQGLSLFNFIR